jgi:hypothetical protein
MSPPRRVELGATWWVALAVVTTGLGVVGRDGPGFLSVFLWSIVGFVSGALIAIAVRGRVTQGGSRRVPR